MQAYYSGSVTTWRRNTDSTGIAQTFQLGNFGRTVRTYPRRYQRATHERRTCLRRLCQLSKNQPLRLNDRFGREAAGDEPRTAVRSPPQAVIAASGDTRKGDGMRNCLC